ncbi:Polyol:NADP oxidoreductase [Carnimonas sp. R-84981]|uniref:mannitol dehydrogenase family protein n=1 Tax=Carnimonas bestiolae TaxID=3402172 RepID=UPI003EDB814D
MLALDKLHPSVSCPQYDRSRLRTRIAHIGFGAFHRAHQAVCAHHLAQEHDSDWGYCELSLFSGQQIANIKQQQCLWSVSELEGNRCQSTVIGVATAALSVPDDGLEAVLDALCEPDIAIVSLTVTEKGYCCSSMGELDTDNELIRHDLAYPHAPRSTPGIILEAIRRRRDAGLAPFSVMSCDNMPNNGETTRGVVVQLAAAQEPSLAEWIERTISFPSTMVDRIVPAVTDEALAAIAAQLGVEDPAGVQCEPFFQWVIEDSFVSGRPKWEQAGATLVNDVRPYEEMKLRMLNGSHSFLAYVGCLSGYAVISECMKDPRLVDAISLLMLKEQAPTLSVEDINLEDYAAALKHRFENKALKHRTAQIATDGSLKLPQRMLNSVRWHLEQGRRFDMLAFGIAAWMHYVSGKDPQGNAIDVRDPLADTLARIASESADAAATVKGFVALESIFGRDLPANATFVATLTDAYIAIAEQGVKAALDEWVSGYR